ncbi:hypothetical protein BS17DRAFT_102043 [Gyrodon lividus]|nr:hypothetical protein BS17DRAFT_102043 [Gyrodon lividus]
MWKIDDRSTHLRLFSYYLYQPAYLLVPVGSYAVWLRCTTKCVKLYATFTDHAIYRLERYVGLGLNWMEVADNAGGPNAEHKIRVQDN